MHDFVTNWSFVMDLFRANNVSVIVHCEVMFQLDQSDVILKKRLEKNETL